jgi:hypothetical protein
MGFIPMYLSQSNMTTGKFDPSFALEFPPMGVSEHTFKILQFADAVTNRDSLNLGNLSDNLEIHIRRVLLPSLSPHNPTPQAPLSPTRSG